MSSNGHGEPPTQPTQPAEGEPVEIPVPTRREFFENMAKVAPSVEPVKQDHSGEEEKPT